MKIMSTATLELHQSDLFNNHVQPREDGLGAIVSPDIPYDEWANSVQACGAAWRGLGKQRDHIQFILADLYLVGEQQFPDQFSQMVDASVIDDKLLTRILWVGKTIPPESRHPKLSFSHHEAVAGVKDSLQRDELLETAEKEGLTVALLTKLRKAKSPTKRDKEPAKKAPQSTVKPPSIDLTDENSILTASQFVLSYLQLEEEKLPFKQWPANRLKAWSPFLLAITKISRRSVIKTHRNDS